MSQLEEVVRYYDSTLFEYRVLWVRRRDQAMHFGYYEDGGERHADALLKMNAVLASLAAVGPDDQVLDAGCGYGGSAMWLAAHVGCRVQGITVVPYQVEKGQREVNRRGLADRVSIDRRDYLDTGYPDGSFDVVWALESAVHADDRRALLAEAYRLLRPGGRLLISEYMLASPLRAADADRHPDLAQFKRGWAMPRLLAAADYQELLKEVGFSSTALHDLTDKVEPSLRRLWRLTRLFSRLWFAVHRLGLVSDFHFQNHLATLAQERAFAAGLWRYQVLVALRGD